MTHRSGKVQRTILVAMSRVALLRRYHGSRVYWRLHDAHVDRRYCESLHAHGYIMHDADGQFVLTEQGKAAASVRSEIRARGSV